MVYELKKFTKTIDLRLGREFIIVLENKLINIGGKMMEIKLRQLQETDLEDYYFWNLPDKAFHNFDGPYFRKSTEEELRKRVDHMKEKFEKGTFEHKDSFKVIANSETDDLIGTVSWYWKSEETLWLEIGIVIFNENYWSKGIGYQVLTQWIDKVFEMRPDISRLGLTTWSGNLRMMKLSEKLGMKQEACYRNARIVEGEYYDSVSYGILKEEWLERKNNE